MNYWEEFYTEFSFQLVQDIEIKVGEFLKNTGIYPTVVLLGENLSRLLLEGTPQAFMVWKYLL